MMENVIHNSFSVNYSIDTSFNSDKFVKLRLDFAHDGINRKKTRFSSEILEEKKDGLFLSPILGHIIQNEDGTYRFGSHDIEFRPNPYQDNKPQNYYIETILGIIPPEEYADFEIKQINGQNRFFVTGYLYKKYSNFAEDLLKEYENTPVSMETDILKYTYSAEEDVYDVLDFRYNGITLLGQEVTPGMIDANAQLFTAEKDTKEQIIIMLQELKSLFCLNADDKNNEKGGLIMNDNQEGTPVSATSEDTPDTTDATNNENTPVINESTIENSEGVSDSVKENANNQTPDTVVPNNITENFEQEGTIETPKISEPTGFIKTFSISHEDIRSSLYEKLMSVEEADNACYYIDNVYNDYFEYSSYEAKKCYRQKYSVGADGSIEFSESRIELYVEKLTVDEKSVLDAMRQNYDAQTAELNSLREFKGKYDLAEKEAVMNKWSTKIGTTQEFTALMENNNYAAYSKEDIETKCKCIFADNTAFNCNYAADNNKAKEFSPISITLNNTDEEDTSSAPYNGFVEKYKSR